MSELTVGSVIIANTIVNEYHHNQVRKAVQQLGFDPHPEFGQWDDCPRHQDVAEFRQDDVAVLLLGQDGGLIWDIYSQTQVDRARSFTANEVIAMAEQPQTQTEAQAPDSWHTILSAFVNDDIDYKQMAVIFAYRHPEEFAEILQGAPPSDDNGLTWQNWRDLRQASSKVERIRIYRNLTGASLRDAKEWVEHNFQKQTTPSAKQRH